MIGRVISGGQTGADQAGCRAARGAGIPTGGAMPRGFLTEAGPRPDFAGLYGAFELESDAYPARTRRNARDSDGTLWFGDHHSAGGKATLDACRALGRPVLIVGPDTRPSRVVAWIEDERVRTLNVAGNRESVSPGIGERVERFLARVFRRLAPAGGP